MTRAIVRDISASMAGCELSFVPRVAIDLELARAQHQRYRQLLEQLGCTVLTLPAQDQLPDSVFVEDVALVLDEVAVMTRPGAPARRAEGATVAESLAQFRDLLLIQAPGTLDGGDILRVGRTLYVGASARSNAAAVEQLRGLLSAWDYQVQSVPIQGCLHLKSAVTQVTADTLLIQPEWVGPEHFPGFTLIEVDPREEHAANALRIGAAVIYPDCFPHTRARLEAAGVNVRTVDVSELQKAEGAVTCCSLVFA
jgi:dimethylargininase